LVTLLIAGETPPQGCKSQQQCPPYKQCPPDDEEENHFQCQAAGCKVQPHKGKNDHPKRPANPSRQPLLGNTPRGKRRSMRSRTSSLYQLLRIFPSIVMRCSQIIHTTFLYPFLISQPSAHTSLSGLSFQKFHNPYKKTILQVVVRRQLSIPQSHNRSLTMGAIRIRPQTTQVALLWLKNATPFPVHTAAKTKELSKKY